MLPPPMTMAISTPDWAARYVCSPMSTTSCMLMPRWPGGAKLSPDSLRMTRLYGLVEEDMFELANDEWIGGALLAIVNFQIAFGNRQPIKKALGYFPGLRLGRFC